MEHRSHDHTGPVAETPKPSGPAPSYANLTVDVLPNGQFKVSYDIDNGAARFVQVYDKSGKPAGDANVEAIVTPPPPAPKLHPEVESKINALESALNSANQAVNDLNGIERNRFFFLNFVTRTVYYSPRSTSAMHMLTSWNFCLHVFP
jgi:hypothetical protein